MKYIRLIIVSMLFYIPTHNLLAAERLTETVIKFSDFTPAYMEQLLTTHGPGFTATVRDDVTTDEDGTVNTESNVSILHMITRTDATNPVDQQKLFELARRIVNARPDFINAQQSEGFTPLHNAAWRGYDDIVRLFLAHGANKSIKDAVKKFTAEQWAQANNKITTARLLADNQVQRAEPKPKAGRRTFDRRNRSTNQPALWIPRSIKQAMPPPFHGRW